MDLASLLQGPQPQKMLLTLTALSCSPEVTAVVASDAGRPQLLHQDADHVDKDKEVHLKGAHQSKKVK